MYECLRISTVKSLVTFVDYQYYANAGCASSIQDVLKIFGKAMDGLTGVNYTPVAVLGVSDDTYCILCKAVVVYPNAKPYNVLVYVNESGIQNIYELWIEKHAEKEKFDDGTSNCA